MEKIFDYSDYVHYINDKLLSYPSGGRGVKLQISKDLRIQSTLVSSIFSGKAHLQMDQALQLSHFLKHSDRETEYFLLLVEKERAATTSLKDFYLKRLKKMQEDEREIEARLAWQKSNLNEQVAMEYYSHWSYAALHIFLATKKKIALELAAKELSLPLEEVIHRLDFLLTNGLINLKDGCYHVGEKHLHLSRMNKQISQHHINWRLKVVDQFLSKNNLRSSASENLHYSVVLGISKEDAAYFREQLVSLIEKNSKRFDQSEEEIVQVFCFDWFQLS